MSNKKEKRQNKKQLSLTAMKNQYKEINKYKEYVWDKETNTVIRYYETFDKAKVEELLLELYKDIEYAAENGLGFFNEESNMMKYTSLLIIKHFTHLKKSIPENFEKKIEHMREMVSIGLVETMFKEVFLESEVQSVFEKIIEAAVLAERVSKIEVSTQEKLERFLSDSENLASLAKLREQNEEVDEIIPEEIKKAMDEYGDI